MSPNRTTLFLHRELAHFRKKLSPTPPSCPPQGLISRKAKETHFHHCPQTFSIKFYFSEAKNSASYWLLGWKYPDFVVGQIPQSMIQPMGCFPSRWSVMSGVCLWCNTENVAVTKDPFKVLLSATDHSTLESVWETQIHSILTPTTSHHTEETSATSGHSETCLNKSEIPKNENWKIGKKRVNKGLFAFIEQ